MKNYSILLIIFVLALFQGAFLSLNLVLLSVLTWAVIRPSKESLLIAFLGGLFLDLTKGTPLGLSGLVFLVAVILVILYRRKFDPLHPVFLPLVVFLSALGYSLVVNRFFDWFEGLILAILALFARLVVRQMATGFDRQGIRLKV